jgi:hypothetical protein
MGSKGIEVLYLGYRYDKRDLKRVKDGLFILCILDIEGVLFSSRTYFSIEEVLL